MIFEIATIAVKAGSEAAFESAVTEALPLFRRARGCESLHLERCIEEPNRYRLVVGWATVEDHMEGFRNSPDFAAWRALVADTFEAPPSVEHSRIVVEGFAARD